MIRFKLTPLSSLTSSIAEMLASNIDKVDGKVLADYPSLAEVIDTYRSYDPISFFSGFEDNVLLKSLTEQLRPDLKAVVEYPYVDKVYRNSYYNHHSSKVNHYPRDCFKVSLFSSEITEGDFSEGGDPVKLQSCFLGFFTLRPTPPYQFIGRSVISPLAYKEIDFDCCTVDVPVSVWHFKLRATGFPFSTQDTETMSCAETSIWALMEYFGNRYPEYRPILPSDIHTALAGQSHERQVPSTGLDMSRISFALRSFGFGTRIYVDDVVKDNYLFDLVSIYLESGIPVLAGISNGSEHHAFLIVGKRSKGASKAAVTTGLNELSTDCDEFVVIDDNLAPYSYITRAEPSRNYPTWAPCKLTTIVVPLYTRINLEAYQAKEYFSKMRGRIAFLGDIANDSSYRMFLASSRSYRDYVQRNKDIATELKDMLMHVMMAKFIWVFEIHEHHSTDVSGLMILDATEPNIEGTLPLTLVYWNERGIVKDGNIFWQFNVASQPFKGFNNLIKYKTTTP